MDALKNLLDNEKGLVGLALIVAATALVGLGKMTVDQWQSFATWIFGIYAGTTALHQSATALSSRGAPAAPPPPAPTHEPAKLPGAPGRVHPLMLACLALFALASVAGVTGAMFASFSGCGAASVVLKTGQCVLDSGVLGQVAGDLAKDNYVQLVADLGTKVGPEFVTCALEAVAAGQAAAATDGGATPGPAALAEGDVRVARARQLLATPSLWQKSAAK